jgi:hypothetical protein
MGFRVSLHSSNPEPLMSALGQKQTIGPFIAMSALPPKADIRNGLIFCVVAPAAWRCSPRSVAPHRGFRNLRQSHHSHIVWPIYKAARPTTGGDNGLSNGKTNGQPDSAAIAS